jgi:hypothetical protein
MSQLIQALKEWSVAVAALEQGKTVLLLRKGGVRETAGRFQVLASEVILFPTIEHQRTDLLKAEYAHQVMPVQPGWHPDEITIRVWATITDVIPLQEPAAVDALYPFHIWSPTFVRDRLHWKPHQPLYALLLRVYRLAQAQTIAYVPAYGGCRSWIELETAIDLAGSQPVLSAADYEAERAVICQVCAAGRGEAGTLG